jgi:calcineurin-like phosphoesterase family protein
MKLWFTSDHHFGHENIIRYCKRPFANAAEMDAAMIDAWNTRVGGNDVVYHLGDFTLGDHVAFWKYYDQLAGDIHIVPGGHDKRWLKRVTNALLMPPLMTQNFSGHVLTLCHYPLQSWELSHYGAHHLHGHTHGTIGVVGASGDVQLPPGQRVGRRLDVSVDCHNFMPLSLDEVVALLEAE